MLSALEALARGQALRLIVPPAKPRTKLIRCSKIGYRTARLEMPGLVEAPTSHFATEIVENVR